jgi:hypothetical protein
MSVLNAGADASAPCLSVPSTPGVGGSSVGVPEQELRPGSPTVIEGRSAKKKAMRSPSTTASIPRPAGEMPTSSQ